MLPFSRTLGEQGDDMGERNEGELGGQRGSMLEWANHLRIEREGVHIGNLFLPVSRNKGCDWLSRAGTDALMQRGCETMIHCKVTSAARQNAVNEMN